MTVATKPVRRETQDVYRGRPLMITVLPRYLEIREKGRRDILSLDYATIYEFALKTRWRREQAEKRLKNSQK